MDKNCLAYHRHLDGIVQRDLSYVRKKDTQYNASWKRRGGSGAWFTIVRPWDRLENIVSGQHHDIFSAIHKEGLDGPDGSVIACIRDLRRYLLLVEAEMMEQIMPTQRRFRGERPEELSVPGTPEDGGHHARQRDPDDLWPWVASVDDYNAIPSKLHNIWSSSSWLEPRITPEQYESLSQIGWLSGKQIQACYSPVYMDFETGEDVDDPVIYKYADSKTPDNGRWKLHAYWLDLSKCPPSERDRYRCLPNELNLKEAESLMEYRELYSWVPNLQRYVLRRRVWRME